jgi:DNA-binding GntR family transcriptional regulator
MRWPSRAIEESQKDVDAVEDMHVDNWLILSAKFHRAILTQCDPPGPARATLRKNR